ncbi:YhfX family PLP-dependent enzyme [Brevibacillus massiliensis]|uniref:YhfX family PLP-dependent enzyme n=1 Tax=Brevibacillus massiliensis TaxID=1118054 RepID=UPI0002ECB97D|nr:YhfX family PLP-dependent enzyme [Brevibacillus massiliensis]
MFLGVTRRRNPQLLEAALYFHQKGDIPPNTYVIDLDAVRENAAHLAKEAKKQQLQLYFMTKQFGRNPIVSRAIVEAGIPKAVAVDPWEARTLAQNGIKLGHVGHLVQIPRAFISEILELNPEVITVFSYDNAKLISDEAVKLGIRQKVLLRVIDDGDFLYPGQSGGFRLRDLQTDVENIMQLPGVEVGGVTSFPCLLVEDDKVKPTPNIKTIEKAIACLKKWGFNGLQANTPSVSSTATLGLLKQLGATHAEPGHALTGTTPLHAVAEQPEKPAMVYVSEVSHLFREKAYVYGGGFYYRSHVKHALVGKQWDQLKQVEVIADEPGSIDYYGTLNSDQVSVGDTALFSFRTQIFVTRASVAVVEGIGKNPKIHGIFDSEGRKS